MMYRYNKERSFSYEENNPKITFSCFGNGYLY